MEIRIPGTMHVLTLTPFYPSEGDEVSGCFVAESLRELNRQGVRSTVIAVDSIYHSSKRPSSDAPAEWIRYPQFPGNFGLSSAGKLLGAVLLNKVLRIHERSPIDLIHAHAALPCGDAAVFLFRRLNIPFVVTIHGLDVFNRCFQDGIAAGWRRKTSLSVYRQARKVICISDKVRQLLAEGMPGQISAKVVYNGTDAELFAPAKEQKESPTILIVGNLLAGKGQELVMKAFARIEEQHPGLQIRMIGEGADRARFEDLAKKLGISDQIHFHGRVGRAEVAEAMRQCAVLVLPSRFEGLGCVYLEAMACGKPVIGCRGQGIEEILRHGENGWLIPVDGLEELTQGLDLLLNDQALRARIGHAARETILQNLTFSHQATALKEIYEEAAR